MTVQIINKDCIKALQEIENESINCCVTSPPYYGLRDYGIEGQIGLEETPEEYTEKIVQICREIKRVLTKDGTLWLNLGDSYAANRTYQVSSTKGGLKHGKGQSVNGKGSKVPEGLKQKDLIGIPWRVAFALQKDGWWLRQDIIWEKPNVMPESVKDRCTRSHEYIFLLSKSEKYYFDYEAIQEDCITKLRKREKNNGESAVETKLRGKNGCCGVKSSKRNKRSVWSIPTKPFKGSHFACFPPALIEPCIKAGCPSEGIVLDPFGGSGTTGEVSEKMGRKSILIEINPEYIELIKGRITAVNGNYEIKGDDK